MVLGVQKLTEDWEYEAVLIGYKIANPTVLARISREELEHLFRGYGYTPYFVEGNEPERMHELRRRHLSRPSRRFGGSKHEAERTVCTAQAGQ